ncbi:hypothetical protein [Streptomyces sp. NBRC 110035]|uniref:hypothetical protein n=1 Tax=Streptomyces sp. NBRC 110035 TaxID=1547867 RepID=UPI000697B8D1
MAEQVQRGGRHPGPFHRVPVGQSHPGVHQAVHQRQSVTGGVQQGLRPAGGQGLLDPGLRETAGRRRVRQVPGDLPVGGADVQQPAPQHQYVLPLPHAGQSPPGVEAVREGVVDHDGPGPEPVDVEHRGGGAHRRHQKVRAVDRVRQHPLRLHDLESGRTDQPPLPQPPSQGVQPRSAAPHIAQEQSPGRPGGLGQQQFQ